MNENDYKTDKHERELADALAKTLRGVTPKRDLWPGIKAGALLPQPRRRKLYWHPADLLPTSIRRATGWLAKATEIPRGVPRRWTVPALGSAVLILFLLLTLPLGQAALARHGADYWYAGGGPPSENDASSYAGFFEREGVNPLVDTGHNIRCAFGVSVDTASYEAARRSILGGQLPAPESVQVESFVNSFAHGYEPPAPGAGEDAFAIYAEGAPSPFGGDGSWLIRAGLQGRLSETGEREVIAVNVQTRVEFNPAVVSRYRQLGYDYDRVTKTTEALVGNQVLSGHSVVALYEVEFHDGAEGRAATVFARYEDPDTGEVRESTREILRSEFSMDAEEASPRFQLDAAAAEYAEILRGSYWARGSSLAAVRELTQRLSKLLPDDPNVAEFASLVARSEPLGRNLGT